MASLRVAAPAKINLALRILGRREDGYHELDTLFQAITLADEIILSERRVPGVELTVTGADVGPTDDNLALRAAHAWTAASGIDPAVAIRLTKRIPAGAGLGGGSSDAGAVLRGLEAIYGAPLGAQRLAQVGATLGADVAFFCGSAGLARGQGIGEVLTEQPEVPRRRLLVVVPSIPVATPAAYGWIAQEREAGAPASNALELEDPRSWADLDAIAGNDFHDVVAREVPEVASAASAMTSSGLEGVLLSGSGSALFGFLPEGDEESVLARVEAATADLGARLFAAETLSALPPPHPGGSQA